MKTIYKKLFSFLANLLDRILFAVQMFPTKNPNSYNWLYDHRLKSTAYPDGTRIEYLTKVGPKDFHRNKVKI